MNKCFEVSPETLATLNERLGDLGMIPNHLRNKKHVALCMLGWVMIVDDRGPERRVSSVPPETTAAALN